ncbi:MAG: tetratricopeptide repeat protein, partial [Pseudomonadota bacterium]|nr:tetratricopeptide repeat protein [Pseudomonadota bacterium]
MLHLDQVTLCCIDTVNQALAIGALTRSTQGIAFGRTLFLTDRIPRGVSVPDDIEVVTIGALPSRAAYSAFVLKELGRHIQTSHVLLVQWDGFVVNPAAWTPDFLDVDYIGAKWFWHDDGMRVGNGGFSLRSKRLLEALADPRIVLQDSEDTTIGRTFRPLLERDHHVRFATDALADRFAFEAAYPIGQPFGFHGLFNFCRAVPPDEIVAMAPTFSPEIANSPQLLQLARNCAALGQWRAVEALTARILQASPDHREAAALARQSHEAGNASRTISRNEPCACGSGRKYKHCHGAIAPTSPLTLAAGDTRMDIEAALAAHQKGDLSTAEATYRRVLGSSADHPVALHYLGVILYQRGQPAEALPLLVRAAEARPDEAEFHNNLGLAFAALDCNDEAIAAHRRAIVLKPDHAGAFNNLGLALAAENRLTEAAAAYRQALAHAPGFGQAHWNLALALLASGQYNEGWREYEWRLALADLGGGYASTPGVRWEGRFERGRTLLLIAEQGLGDTLQFARFAQPLAAMGMNITMQVAPALMSVVASVPGVRHVVSAADREDPHCDAYLPLLSVAGKLGIDADTIPNETPYITADPLRRSGMRELVARAHARIKVGVCWAGSPQHANDRRRSIAFGRLAPLLAKPDIAWFSLQHGARTGPPLIDSTACESLDDLAALVNELDLILTVDTSVAHLAGALDRPTWLLLPFAADWRWGTGTETSPWYPSMR